MKTGNADPARAAAQELAIELAARLLHALTVARLHDLGNAAAQETVSLLRHAIAAATAEGPFALRFEHEAHTVFGNGIPLRGARNVVAMGEALLAFTARRGIGELHFTGALGEDDVRALARAAEEERGDDAAATFVRLRARLEVEKLTGKVEVVSIENATGKASQGRTDGAESDAPTAWARAQAVVREYESHLHDRSLHRLLWSRITRSVQTLVELAATRKRELLALTVVKTIDDAAQTHAVNTAILAILVGREAGLKRPQLRRLGVAALLHGLGRSESDRVAAVQGLEPRSPEAKDGHSIERALCALLETHRTDDTTLATALVAVEQDGERKGHPVTRIVQLCAAYDQFATPGPTRRNATPERALNQLLQGTPRRFEPLLLALLVNVLGAYPPGTVVSLDTGEVAVVVHPNDGLPRRPVVAVVRDAKGHPLGGALLDLGLNDGRGAAKHAIVEAVDAAERGIEVPAHLRA